MRLLNIKVIDMGERLKIFGIVAVFGFLAGVIAQLSADYAIPWLVKALPALFEARWMLSGIAGSLLTVGLVSVWAYMTGNKDR
jgi:hypothetical protein